MSAALAFAEGIPGVSPDVYGPADFAAVRDIVRAAAGIVLNERKTMLVYSRLAPLVRETGTGTFAGYVALIRDDSAERMRAVKALTTNHTFFFREAHHFDHLARNIRPQLVQKLARGKRVRLWSAGCSSGEETWSIMMTLLGEDRGEGLKIAGGDLRLLASDLATHALSKARSATYPVSDIAAVPAALRTTWSRAAGDSATMVDDIRRLVRFRELNLLAEWPMQGQFDVIFCRNVMIYFDNETNEKLIERFARMLAPGGHLYIGHSERATGKALELLQPVGPTIYQRALS